MAHKFCYEIQDQVLILYFRKGLPIISFGNKWNFLKHFSQLEARVKCSNTQVSYPSPQLYQNRCSHPHNWPSIIKSNVILHALGSLWQGHCPYLGKKFHMKLGTGGQFSCPVMAKKRQPLPLESSKCINLPDWQMPFKVKLQFLRMLKVSHCVSDCRIQHFKTQLSRSLSRQRQNKECECGEGDGKQRQTRSVKSFTSTFSLTLQQWKEKMVIKIEIMLRNDNFCYSSYCQK